MKDGKEQGGEEQDEGKEASNRNWLRPHTQIKHNFAISNSLNMQKPQVNHPLLPLKHHCEGCALRIIFSCLC